MTPLVEHYACSGKLPRSPAAVHSLAPRVDCHRQAPEAEAPGQREREDEVTACGGTGIPRWTAGRARSSSSDDPGRHATGLPGPPQAINHKGQTAPCRDTGRRSCTGRVQTWTWWAPTESAPPAGTGPRPNNFRCRRQRCSVEDLYAAPVAPRALTGGDSASRYALSSATDETPFEPTEALSTTFGSPIDGGRGSPTKR